MLQCSPRTGERGPLPLNVLLRTAVIDWFAKRQD